MDRLDVQEIKEIKVIRRDSVLEGSFLYYCEEFWFRGKFMYEKFVMVENFGDYRDEEVLEGPDWSNELENELARYVIIFYAENYYK